MTRARYLRSTLEGRCFHRFSPSTGSLETTDAGETVCALGLAAGCDKLAVATARGIALWNHENRSLAMIADEPDGGWPAGSRLNDAAVDSQGNFWVGSRPAPLLSATSPPEN
jgi:sugar lactone lactonase YvrE